MNNYTAGALVRMTAAFATAAGVPTSAGAVTMRVIDPSGALTDLSSAVVVDAVGSYHADFVTSLVGVHLYEWLSTGGVIAAKTGQFNVNVGTF